MILEITQLGNPMLREIARTIDTNSGVGLPQRTALIANMIETMEEARGVGIAAPQVGESLRIFVVASKPSDRYPNAPVMNAKAMINPQIVLASDEIEKDWEGCLSIPGIRGLVPRHKKIRVKFFDAASLFELEVEYEGFVARIFQHELDHLDGVVFLDRVTDSRELVTDQEYRRIVKV